MSTPLTSPGQVVADGLVFTEVPRWHDGELWFGDMHSGSIFRVDAAGELHEVVTLGEHSGGIGWLPDGSLLVVACHSRRLLRFSDGKLTVHADLGDTGTADLNDLWVDSQGRAYVGDMGFDVHAFGRLMVEGRAEEAMGLVRPSNVFLVRPDGSFIAAGPTPMMFPNGIVVDEAAQELVVAESFGLKLSIWPIREDGTLGAGRDLADLGFAPDGISLDASGGVWVADPSGCRVVLVDRDGQPVREIATEHKSLSVAVGDDCVYVATSPVTDPSETAALREARIERFTL